MSLSIAAWLVLANENDSNPHYYVKEKTLQNTCMASLWQMLHIVFGFYLRNRPTVGDTNMSSLDWKSLNWKYYYSNISALSVSFCSS